MIDEIDLQNTIADLRDEVSNLERQVDGLQDQLDISIDKKDCYYGLLSYVKDRKEHAEAMGDNKSVEIYADILKKA
jgi:hypothetical protein